MNTKISTGEAKFVFHELLNHAGVDDSYFISEDSFLETFDLDAKSLAQIMYSYATEIGFCKKEEDAWLWAINNDLIEDTKLHYNSVINREDFIIILHRFYTTVPIWASIN